MSHPTVFGADLTELTRRVGSLDQVARIDSFEEREGAARGSRRIRVVTGGGLEFELHPDRSLDIGNVTYRGVPVAWMSPTGMVAPSITESNGRGWLRGFGGGLLATCGLDSFGPPTSEGGVDYPMHGRIGAVPAVMTEASIHDGRITVAGTVRQTSVFGENLVLRRRVTADLGGTEIRVDDTVTNEGSEAAGHMVLYHCNIGWPLLDEHAQLSIPSTSVVPRDAAAEAGAALWHTIEPPQAGFAEQVFRHDFSDVSGARVTVDNEELGIKLDLGFDSETLPALHQWKMSGEGHYVMGLEPTNVDAVHGRAGAAEDDHLPELASGESVAYALQFSFATSGSGKKRRS